MKPLNVPSKLMLNTLNSSLGAMFAGLLVWNFYGNVEAQGAIEVGQVVADFSLKDSTGKKHKLSSYRGKHVVLEWTSTQCPFVVDHYERKTMTGTFAKFMKKKVVWLAVDSSHYATAKESEKWRQRWRVNYPILQDPSGRVGKQFNARRTPHMFIIDAKGVLRYDGAIDDDPSDAKKNKLNFVEKGLASLVKGQKLAKSKTKPYGCTVKYK